MLNENFQRTLKFYRKAQNLTQEDLAMFLNVSPQTIYKYENGVSFPPPRTLEKILDFFKIDPNTLFGYEKENGDSDVERIKGLVLAHKLFYREYGRYNVSNEKKQDALDIIAYNFMKESGISYEEQGYSKEDIREVKRIMLTWNITKILKEIENKAYEEGLKNPIPE